MIFAAAGGQPKLQEETAFWYKLQPMGHEVLKSGTIVLLYCLFVFTGVTWAFDPCFDGDGQLSHATSDSDHDADPASNSDPSDDSLPVLQDLPDVYLADESYAANNVRLNALFKRNTLFCSHNDLPYRLFLSILQI
jgi:hypothetical protein